MALIDGDLIFFNADESYAFTRDDAFKAIQCGRLMTSATTTGWRTEVCRSWLIVDSESMSRKIMGTSSG